MEIRQGRQQLLQPGVGEVWALSMYRPDPGQVLQRANILQNDETAQVFVAWEEAGPVGMLLLRRGLGERYIIEGIGVKAQGRRRGVGSLLLKKAIAGLEPALLEAETDDDAVGFYRRLGFEVESLGEKYPGVVRYLCRWRRESASK